MLTFQQPLRTAAMSAFPYSEGMEGLYRFKTSFGDVVEMSIRDGNTLWVPRETCPVGVEDYRRLYTPPVAIDCNFEPRSPEQAVLIPKSVELLKAGVNHIFKAPTGWGKTVAGGVIACEVGQPTLIVVTKEDLMQQWKDTLLNVLRIPPHLIGHVQQDTCDWQGKRIVLAMVHSLVIPDRYPKEMYDYFGLMILDEVHLMAADTFIRVCQKVPARLRLGLSATPKRTDGKMRLVESHVGPILVQGTEVPMRPKVLVRRTGWRIPRPGGKAIPYTPGQMMPVFKAMGASEPRNLEISAFVVQAYQKQRRTLILADMIEGQLQRLFQVLCGEGIPGNDIGYYVGGMSKSELDHHKMRPVVLGTYKMCSTGTNVPEWDTLVMANPRAEVEQIVGRVIRYMTNKNQPIILDLVDGEKIFHQFYLKRLKTYYKVGAEIVEV